MGEVVDLPVITKLDCPPDRILESAMGELTGVVVLGWTEDGEGYFASSIANEAEVLWLIEHMKMELLNGSGRGD